VCGISGAIGYVGDNVVESVRRAHDAMFHRGPDGDGLIVERDRSSRGVVLAHRRLAIIDLSPAGHQPMVDAESGCTIVFNGEIYGFQALRAELESAGQRFRSRSDTEVILKAYAAWGDRCVERFQGMFAFALWDPRRRRVLLARDHLGIKPLYLARVGVNGAQSLIFASELRAMLATGLVSRRADPVALGSFAWNGFVVGPSTMVKEVRLVPAGTTIAVDVDLRSEERRFWQLPMSTGQGQPGAMETFRETLDESVRRHLVADVPVGLFFSGGVDSTSVAAIAKRVCKGSIKTFNVSFDEAAFDESGYARQLARTLGTEHHDIRVTQQDFVDALPKLLASIDQPTFDAMNTFLVSRAVKDAGITVALAGTGGDEIFGGYRSFRDLPLASRVSQHVPRAAGPLVDRAGRAIARAALATGHVPPQTRWGKALDVLGTGGDLLALYQLSYSLFTRGFLGELVNGMGAAGLAHGLPVERARELELLSRGSSTLHAISQFEISCFLGERLLRDTDAASMAVSLEVRVPLVDHTVVAAAAALPDETRFAPLGRKLALRHTAMGRLEEQLFERPKSGFVLPIERWMRQRLRERVGATLLDAPRCSDLGLDPKAVAALWREVAAGRPGFYFTRVWAPFVLLEWAREHRVHL